MAESTNKKAYKDIKDLSLIEPFNPDFDSRPKNKIHTKWILKITFLLLFLLSLVRVPYSGSYIDAYLFEYLFGFTKYLIYALVLFFIICWFLNKNTYRKMTSPGFIVGSIFIFVLVSIILSAISSIVFENNVWNIIHNSVPEESNFTLRLSYYHSNYFFPYANNNFSFLYKGVNNLWFVNTRMALPSNANQEYAIIFSGGFIGEFLVTVNYWIIIILSFVLILLVCVLFIRRSNSRLGVWIRKKVVKSFGADDKQIKKEFTKEQDHVLIPTLPKAKITNAAIKLDLKTPPLSFLTDTSVNNNKYNRIDANKIIHAINQIIESSNLNIKFESINIMPLFTEIRYHADKSKDIDEFIKKGSQISSASGLTQFYISTKGNNINFEYQNDKPSKISIKSTLINNNIGSNNCYAIAGVDESGNQLFMDFKSDSSILIVGKKGSGINMLLSCLIISSAYISSPVFLNFDFITNSHNSAIQSITNIPHIKNVISTSSKSNIKQLLDLYVQEIKVRKAKLVNAKVADQKSFNNVCNKFNMKPMVTKVLVINNFDEIIANNFQCMPQINYILKECNKLGICLILHASEINGVILNENILNNIMNTFVLKTDSQAQSLNLLGSYRACQLYGSGDGYLLLNNKNKSKLRFQTCYLNQEELTQIAKTISVFYKTKNN